MKRMSLSVFATAITLGGAGLLATPGDIGLAVAQNVSPTTPPPAITPEGSRPEHRQLPSTYTPAGPRQDGQQSGQRQSGESRAGESGQAGQTSDQQKPQERGQSQSQQK